MRHALFRKKAILIDHFIDDYRKVRRLKRVPHNEVKLMIHLIFPGSTFAGEGAFKRVYRVASRGRDLVLKVSNPNNLKNDERVYKRLPKSIRNRYFAKIHWRTKYCLLQKYGKKVEVPSAMVDRLKAVGKQNGLIDVRSANIRKVDGKFRIVDANLSNARTNQSR